jgi:hypothetical protein
MRKLTTEQKKIVEKWFNENWKGANTLRNSDDMPLHLQEKLQALNNYETMWMDVDRYIFDRANVEVFINNGW